MKKPKESSRKSSDKPKSRFSGRRKLRLTKEGRAYVAVSIGVGLAAINTGNNLLYLLLGWLLSIILASGFMSNAMLRAISVRRHFPSRLHAGRLASIELAVTNKKRLLVSYSIQIEDIVAGHSLDQQCFLLRVDPKTTISTHYLHGFSRRGRHTFDGFRLITRFPFGLFEKSLFVAESQTVTVLPLITAVRKLPASSQPFGDSKANYVGRHGEFFGLRGYRDGDDKRSIHWTSTARRNQLLVREFETESQRQITIVVDNAVPVDADWAFKQGIEAAIVRAASYANEYARRNYAIALVTRSTHVPFAAGQGQLHRVLYALAVLPAASPTDPFVANPTPSGATITCSPSLGQVSLLSAA